jgi:UDP-N-acetylglucosamine acyltransferase
VIASTIVHPTALVDPQARLGQGVEIGPYAIIEAGVTLGERTKVLARAHITGSTTIGPDCEIHMGAVVGHLPQDLGFKGGDTRLVIGPRTIIRENATIHRATKEGGATVIGADCYLMAVSHVAHDCKVGDRVIVCNGALLAGHVQVGDRAFISGNVVVHQFVRIGALCMLSGNTAVGMDAAPFSLVTGRNEWRALNTIGMRRAGIPSERRSLVKRAYQEMFAAPGKIELALSRLDEFPETPEIEAIRTFFAASRRGFLHPEFTASDGDSSRSDDSAAL